MDMDLVIKKWYVLLYYLYIMFQQYNNNILYIIYRQNSINKVICMIKQQIRCCCFDGKVAAVFYWKHVRDQMERKEPLELDINKNVFASGVIILLFDINITNYIFKLHRKKIFISQTKINFLNITVLETLLLLFNIKIY